MFPATFLKVLNWPQLLRHDYIMVQINLNNYFLVGSFLAQAEVQGYTCYNNFHKICWTINFMIIFFDIKTSQKVRTSNIKDVTSQSFIFYGTTQQRTHLWLLWLAQQILIELYLLLRIPEYARLHQSAPIRRHDRSTHSQQLLHFPKIILK